MIQYTHVRSGTKKFNFFPLIEISSNGSSRLYKRALQVSRFERGKMAIEALNRKLKKVDINLVI